MQSDCLLLLHSKVEEPDSKGKDLIIYIDDPISIWTGTISSSMFSLIESLIAKPFKNADGSNGYRYRQLFISTHNLDFLEVFEEVSTPKKKVPAGEGKTKSVDDNEHFMVERNGPTSNIMLMPSYLKDYITDSTTSSTRSTDAGIRMLRKTHMSRSMASKQPSKVPRSLLILQVPVPRRQERCL